MPTENKICVWPDYMWCYREYVEDFMPTWGVSDDYMVLDVPAGVDDIDLWLEQTKPQG